MQLQLIVNIRTSFEDQFCIHSATKTASGVKTMARKRRKKIETNSQTYEVQF